MMSCGWKWREFWTLLILGCLFFNVRAQFSCDNSNGNYTSNSTYAANLNSVLTSLYTNVNDTGFYAASVGQNQNTVNALAMCRGDAQLQRCRGCIQNATVDVLNSCPNQMQAIIWYELCMVRFSNRSILGIYAFDPGYWMRNPNNATSFAEFQTDLRTLLEELRGRAASGGPLRKVAAGNRTGPDFQTIFALVQCTPDLSSDVCTSCLMAAANDLPLCCDGRRGGRVLRPSCNLRYEIYSFVNETRLVELDSVPSAPMPPLPPPPITVTPPPPPGSSGNNTTRTIIIVVSAISGLIILILIICILFRKKMKLRLYMNTQNHPPTEDEISSVESLQYDFNKIRAATDDFSDANKLGQGGFGAVYKGKLQNGQQIAVKRLSRGSGQGDLEFKNEVELLARLQHRNLVRLLGFSLEGMEKLLIYEFVENASLDQFIFDSQRRSLLEWVRRYKIIGGFARGLLYLHEDSRLRIIHRDLKAGNVLLDGDMNPKIADFGTARLFDTDETQRNTSRVVGTYGYMAPEYAMHGQFSVKLDVFSFGVLVLEIISGQKNNSFRNGEFIEDLISCAWTNWRDGTAVNIIDPTLRPASGIPRDILRCIHIALLCVQENASDRPTMASVVLMLNSLSITLPVPSEPAFFVPSGYGLDHALLQQSSSREIESTKSAKSVPSAQNDELITELYPR